MTFPELQLTYKDITEFSVQFKMLIQGLEIQKEG